MMEIFQYRDYRDYLKNYVEELPRKGRGVKKEMAEVLRCHPTQISHAFAKKTNLTIEQALEICHFFQWSEEVVRHFLLLAQYQRAEHFKLKEYYAVEIEFELKKREMIKKSVEQNEKISTYERQIYYSAWYYSAIHVLLSVSEFQDPKLLENYLPIAKERFYEALAFLIKAGLAEKKKNKIVMTRKKVEFTRGSEEHRSFLKNWRTQASFSIDRNKDENIHSTFILSFSPAIRAEIVSKWQVFINEIKPMVESCEEEKVCCLSFDFFDL